MGPVSYGIRLDLPAGWLALPTPDTDVRSWASAYAEELWSIQPAPPVRGQVDDLAEHLAAIAGDCPSPPPVLRFALLPAPTLPVAVVGEVRQLAPDDDSAPFGPDALVGSSRVDLQACKLEYSIVSPK